MSLGAACVLPDYDIVIEDDDINNKYAVRFVDSTILSPEADAACGKDGCSQPFNDPSDALPQFLDPSEYTFCTCDGEKTDVNALAGVTLYVEDQDENPRTREAEDELYAMVQIDPDLADPEPYKFVTFLDFVDPGQPLRLSDKEYKPPRRRTPHLRELRLGEQDGRKLDLCNDAGDAPLAPGFHTLRFIVTDRPWFARTENEIKQPADVGVPDLAKGATFDTLTLVFHCDEATVPHCATECQTPEAGL